MKKGIIAVSLLLSGALLITPITNALSKSDEKETTVKPVKIEQNVQSEKIESTDKINEVNNKTTHKFKKTRFMVLELMERVFVLTY